MKSYCLKNNRLSLTIGIIGMIFLVIVGGVSGFASAEEAPVLLHDGSASQLILIKIDTSALAITDILPEENIVYDYSSMLPGTYAVKTPAGYTQDEALVYYAGIPGVVYAEPDTQAKISTQVPEQTQSSPTPVIGLIAGFGAVAVLLRLRK